LRRPSDMFRLPAALLVMGPLAAASMAVWLFDRAEGETGLGTRGL